MIGLMTFRTKFVLAELIFNTIYLGCRILVTFLVDVLESSDCSSPARCRSGKVGGDMWLNQISGFNAILTANMI